MGKSKNRVSVVIVTLNSEKEVERTINSFINQKYKEKELIVIDGKSSDKTVDILKKYQKHISYWISEPDRGISDAFNKGVRASTGDYLYFIGAGDYFWKNDSLEKIMDGVDSKKDMLVCGRINRTTEDGNIILYTSSIKFEKWMLLYKMGLPHQGLFTNRKYIEKYGSFNLNCKYAMDYELLLRAYKEFPKVIMKDVIVAAWKAGGVGKGKTLEVLEEFRKIRLMNNIAPKILINIIDIASRIKYLTDTFFESGKK